MTTAEVVSKERSSDHTTAPRKGGGGPKKPVRPDFDERDTKVTKLQGKIAEFQNRSKAITKQLDEILSSNKGNSRLEGLKRELAEHRHLKQQLLKRREAAKSSLQELSPSESKRGSAVKKGTPLASTDDITNAMTRLQQKLQNTSDPEDQRRTVEQIQKLHHSYEQLTGSKDGEVSQSSERLRNELSATMSQCSSDMDEVSKKEDAVRAQLDKFRQEQNATEPEIQALKEERDQCNEIINTLRAKVSEIRDQWQEAFATYKIDMDAWKVDMDAMWAEKRKTYAEEDKARDAERQRRELENKGDPFAAEIIMCDQLSNWCAQYKQSVVTAAVDKVADASPVMLDGMVMFTKANIEDDDSYVAKRVGKGKKKSGRKSVTATAVESKPKEQKIILDMDALAMFSKLRLPVPGQTSDVPQLLEKVAAKKAEYKSKQTRSLAGETIAPEPAEHVQKKAVPAKSPAGTVDVSMRCDEVFGTVLLELSVA